LEMKVGYPVYEVGEKKVEKGEKLILLGGG
jgi:hypothetical protein